MRLQAKTDFQLWETQKAVADMYFIYKIALRFKVLTGFESTNRDSCKASKIWSSLKYYSILG